MNRSRGKSKYKPARQHWRRYYCLLFNLLSEPAFYCWCHRECFDPDPQGTILWETFWIRTRCLCADQQQVSQNSVKGEYVDYVQNQKVNKPRFFKLKTKLEKQINILLFFLNLSKFSITFFQGCGYGSRREKFEEKQKKC